MNRQLVHCVMVIFLGLVVFFNCDKTKNPIDPTNPADMEYNLTIDPADFINANFTGNAFMPLAPGTTFFYEGENEDGDVVRVEEKVTNQTRVVMGVTCVVVSVQEYEAGDLVEDTDDWYAQDNDGNIWYFGEDVEDYENGQVVSTSGSWEAGVDGALPGVIMFANPIVGTWYRQEYYEGEAEDVGQVLSLTETVTVPFGTFNNCLQTAEWNPLEPGIVENKFYAEGVGLLRTIAVEGEVGFEDLTNIVLE